MTLREAEHPEAVAHLCARQPQRRRQRSVGQFTGELKEGQVRRVARSGRVPAARCHSRGDEPAAAEREFDPHLFGRVGTVCGDMRTRQDPAVTAQHAARRPATG
jgi:hypothetical protein